MKWTKEYTKEYNKEYYLKNREQIKERQKEYKLKNKEHIKKNDKEYRLENKERIAEYRFKNREHIAKQKKEYTSRPETKKLIQKNYSNRYKTDINYKLLKICRARLLKALKGFDKSAPTMELVGCTPDELRRHIESLFEPWMNWENQGLGGWDIEHIKACSNFNMVNPEQQRACFNWRNLQPLEHIANIKKGAK